MRGATSRGSNGVDWCTIPSLVRRPSETKIGQGGRSPNREHALLRRDHVEPAAETVEATALETVSLPHAADVADGEAVGQPSAPETSAPVAPGYNRVGSGRFLRASLALFLAGFATFSLLYCVQPLLPAFARDYGISPAASAMALSLTTGALAVAIFVSGAASQLLPRRGSRARCWAGCRRWRWPISQRS